MDHDVETVICLAVNVFTSNSGLPALDGVACWFCGVLSAARGGPPDGTRRRLLDSPLRVLLEPVVMPALRHMFLIKTQVLPGRTSRCRTPVHAA
jgi:hypothetical protein